MVSGTAAVQASVTLVILVLAAVLSALSTVIVRRLALRHAWLDVPNERSSHSRVTPRGGGVAIAVVYLATIAVAGQLGWVESGVVTALAGSALLVVVGLVDDRRGLSAASRLMCHIAAAGWAVWHVGAPGAVHLGTIDLSLGPAAPALAVLFVVWCVNLYNFMDGIDGLAAAEAVFVGTAAGLLSFAVVGTSDFAALALAAAASGFLLFNWSPARIFMGDAGSGFLGYTVGVLALASDTRSGLPLVVWMLLLGAFLFDATITLARRALRGEPWYAAHRRHAYQRLVIAGWSHSRVVIAVLVVNVVLALLAYVAIRLQDFRMPIAIALLLLITAYVAVESRKPMFP